MRNRHERPRIGTTAARASLAALMPLGLFACFSSERSGVHLDPAETQAITHADVVAHAESLGLQAALDLSCVPSVMTAAPEPDFPAAETTTTSAGIGSPTGDDDTEGTPKSPDSAGASGAASGSKAKGTPAPRQGDDRAGPDTGRLGAPRSASEAAERGYKIGPQDTKPLVPAPPRSAVTPEAVSPTAPAETAPPR